MSVPVSCFVRSNNYKTFTTFSCQVKHMDEFLEEVKRLCENNNVQKALQRVNELHADRFPATVKILSCLLQACTNKKDLCSGRDIYGRIMKLGFHNSFLANQLIRMFAACASLSEADQVFNHVCKPNVFTWTVIISAHVNNDHSEQAIILYSEMWEAATSGGGVKPDAHIFVIVLKACINTGNIVQGRLVHEHVRQCGLETHSFVVNSLINMYCKFNRLLDAEMLFENFTERDSVTWGVIITGYVQAKQTEKAINHFVEMRKMGVKPNHVTFVCVLKACSGIASFVPGNLIYEDIVNCGFDRDISVGNTLVYMYVECGSLDDALNVFHSLEKRDKVSWNVLVEAYEDAGQSEKAFLLFLKMQEEGVHPDRVSFFSILRVCSSTLSLHQGRLVHNWILSSGFDSDTSIVNTLVDMYAKCGSFVDAYKLFVQILERDIVSWNAIINACTQHNKIDLAFELLKEMMLQGVTPNDVTYVSLLSAGNHAGLFDEGVDHCNVLEKNTTPLCRSVEYHHCLVNLLGSAGQLKEADDLLHAMPQKPKIVGWRSLLNHCKSHICLEQGQECFDHFI